MTEQITAILTPVVLAAVGALASVAVVAIAAGRDHVVKWIKSRTNANQQAVIDRVAAEAYAYAEKWAQDQGLPKFQAAAQYLAGELAGRGIDISGDKIMAAIQSAWEQYGRKPTE